MAIAPASDIAQIESILGDDAESLLGHTCNTISSERLHLPGPDFVDRVVALSDRPTPVLRSLQSLYSTTAGWPARATSRSCPSTRASSTRPARRSPRTPTTSIRRRIVELAIEGGCNAVATTLGALGATARRYAHRIPFLLKLNHNEFLSYPNTYDQIMFASVRQAREQGCVAVGATIYFGSAESKRQIQEVSAAFAAAHELGMATVLWCYLRNSAFSAKDGGPDYHIAADLTDQANHLGVTIEADIIKQKAPETAAAGLPRPELRQDRQARLLRAADRAPDRHDPLPGGQLLHGPRRA